MGFSEAPQLINQPPYPFGVSDLFFHLCNGDFVFSVASPLAPDILLVEVMNLTETCEESSRQRLTAIGGLQHRDQIIFPLSDGLELLPTGGGLEKSESVFFSQLSCPVAAFECLGAIIERMLCVVGELIHRILLMLDGDAARQRDLVAADVGSEVVPNLLRQHRQGAPGADDE